MDSPACAQRVQGGICDPVELSDGSYDTYHAAASGALYLYAEIFCGGHRDHRNPRIGGKGFEDSSCFDGYTEQAVSEDLR